MPKDPPATVAEGPTLLLGGCQRALEVTAHRRGDALTLARWFGIQSSNASLSILQSDKVTAAVARTERSVELAAAVLVALRRPSSQTVAGLDSAATDNGAVETLWLGLAEVGGARGAALDTA